MKPGKQGTWVQAPDKPLVNTCVLFMSPAAQRREEKVQGKETAGCVPLKFNLQIINDGLSWRVDKTIYNFASKFLSVLIDPFNLALLLAAGAGAAG